MARKLRLYFMLFPPTRWLAVLALWVWRGTVALAYTPRRLAYLNTALKPRKLSRWEQKLVNGAALRRVRRRRRNVARVVTKGARGTPALETYLAAIRDLIRRNEYMAMGRAQARQDASVRRAA